MLSPINPKRETTYEDSTITSPEEREKHFGQKDHVREFGKDYASVLEKAGFEVEENRFAQTLSAEDLDRFAIAKKENLNIEHHIFIAHKKQ